MMSLSDPILCGSDDAALEPRLSTALGTKQGHRRS
jgi:hypothetical protein